MKLFGLRFGILVGVSVLGIADAFSRPLPPAHAAAIPQTAQLDETQQKQLNALIERHNRIRQRLAPDVQSDLDQLVVLVRRKLFAAPLPGNLFGATTGIVRQTVPGLTPDEAAILTDYVLGGIAAGKVGTGATGATGVSSGAIGAAARGSSQNQLLDATKSVQETQMRFNLQYLKLQSQMQHENRSYTAISNIMKTKHDTVKNSISNIR